MAKESSVLIVDDAMTVRTTIRAIFARNGFSNVSEASNGWQAVESYREKRPTVVTMDLKMPEMGGLEAIQMIRAVDPTAKIIVCSGHGSQQDVLRALNLGAIDFVAKPFSAERLREAILKAA